jgi:PKD repeat protein
MMLLRRTRSALLLSVFVFLLVVGSCKQVDFTAPSGSTFSITAQPSEIGYGGSSTITVVGTRDNGAPLPDGTVFTFTVDANLGTISPNPVETHNGVVNTTFRAGGRSGTATVKAESGQATVGTGANATVDIKIGDARATKLIVSVNPTNLPTGGGTSQVRAIVTDDAGNQLSGIGVIFSADHGTLQSGGKVIRTNENGAAFDTLTTTELTTVTATTLNGTTATATVNVGPTTGACAFSISPTDPVVGQVVTFTDTSADTSNIRDFLWDFGDGSTARGKSVTHVYQSQGTFSVIHSIVNNQGFTTICDAQTVTVGSTAITCEFTFSPDSPKKNQAVTFDASGSFSTTGDIRRYSWDFGDGSPIRQQSNPVIIHSFASNGDFTVTLTVEDTTGEEETCSNGVGVGSTQTSRSQPSN